MSAPIRAHACRLAIILLASAVVAASDRAGVGGDSTWASEGHVTMSTSGLFTTIMVQTDDEGLMAFRAQHEKTPATTFEVNGPGRILYTEDSIAIMPVQSNAPTWIFTTGEKASAFRTSGVDVRRVAVVGLARFADLNAHLPTLKRSEPMCEGSCNAGASSCSVGCGTTCSVTCTTGYWACCSCSGAPVCNCCKA